MFFLWTSTNTYIFFYWNWRESILSLRKKIKVKCQNQLFLYKNSCTLITLVGRERVRFSSQIWRKKIKFIPKTQQIVG